MLHLMTIMAIAFSDLTSNIPLLIGVILGIYDVIARAIPTVKDITIVGNIIKILQSISDFLNAKKVVSTEATATNSIK